LWEDMDDRRKYFEEFAKNHGFDYRNTEYWYHFLHIINSQVIPLSFLLSFSFFSLLPFIVYLFFVCCKFAKNHGFDYRNTEYYCHYLHKINNHVMSLFFIFSFPFRQFHDYIFLLFSFPLLY
jgi:hypothetical protein